MGWDDPNPFYNPEKFGLEQVAQIDYSSGSYEFEYRVIWKHAETGLYYTARNGGCSCPTPFEDYKTLEDLDRLAPSEIEEEVRTEVANEYGYSGDNPAEFLEKLRAIKAGA